MAWRHHQKEQPKHVPNIRERMDPITMSCLEKTIILAALQLYRTHPLVQHDTDVEALCKRFEGLAAFPTAAHKVVDA